MYRVLVPAVVLFAMAGCATEGSAPPAAEVPVPRDQNIANHTNTIIRATFGNGDRAVSVFGADNTVKTTYTSSSGPESDEGTWTLSDDGVLCLKWKKWEASCWKDYKVGDQYVAYEQGGKKRKVKFTVSPRS